jgi:transcriptional regulator with XRE-family HTH domain
MTIFERIKELADKQGKSLQKVSEELGFSSNYLYQLKRQTPAADKLALIADYFNVSVDYLLGRSNFYNDNERDFKYFFGSTVKPTHFDKLSYQAKKNLDNLSLFLNSENIEKNEPLLNWVVGVTTIYSELIFIKNGIEKFDTYFELAMRLAILKFEEQHDTIENFDATLGAINRTAIDFMESVDPDIYSQKLLDDFIQGKEPDTKD